MMKHILLTLSICLSFAALGMAEGTSRTSFDHDWRFARFGKMPDGTFAFEPGAATGTIVASSEESGNPASNAIDGKRETRWCASSEAKNQWLRLDLGRSVPLRSVHIVWEKDTDNPFSLATSADGVHWIDISDKRTARGVEQTIACSTNARYVMLKVDGSGGSWASVRSLEPRGRDRELITPQPPAASDPQTSPDQTAYDDSQWRVQNLPHDWAIEGPFRMEIENETGKLPWEGIGWYRKTFDVPASASNRRIYVDFDGAMSQPKVYINGHFAGQWAYGYNSFRIDATPHLKFGAKNTIAVRLENLPASTRWYPGAGIYRHVWMVDSPPIHVAHWGTYITTPEISDAQATVAVETTIDNTSHAAAKLIVRSEILQGDQVVATQDTQLNALSIGTSKVTTRLTVAKPQLWDITSPHLYTLRTTVLNGGKIIDSKLTNFGIRQIQWDAQKGFLLNGRKVVLKGVCNHHDLGPLGAAVNTRAMQRQIEILQEMGCNSIRMSHNPPAPELLDLCDRMGILVIDEAFDIWKLQKYGKVNGYNIFWDDWHEKDIRNFILRDRNHPCIIAWSTGNEVPELGNTSMHWVPEKLRDLIKQYDATRPVTAGSNNPRAATNGFQNSLDAYGVNYHLGSYDGLVNSLPNMPLYASETSSTVSTRGEYFFPVDWDKSKGFYQFQVSSYDLYAPGWANRPDLQFEKLDQHPRIAGEYVWTGFDYIGEPTPYNQDKSNALNFSNEAERKKAMALLEKLGSRAPSRSSYFGILDLCGFKKDRFYLYQARWRPDHPMAHILPHWNWPERRGEVTPVHVYTSGDEAELFLNGRSLGTRRIGEPHRYRLTWDNVKYQPGKLEVVVTKRGKPWATATQETTSKATQLELTADRNAITADGSDLSYLTIRVLDAARREVPRTRIPVSIRVSGAVELVGIGNGDPTDHTPMNPGDPSRATIIAFNGRAQVIVRSKEGQPGKGMVEVTTHAQGRASVNITTSQ